jgi:hypothetical protein
VTSSGLTATAFLCISRSLAAMSSMPSESAISQPSDALEKRDTKGIEDELEKQKSRHPLLN